MIYILDIYLSMYMWNICIYIYICNRRVAKRFDYALVAALLVEFGAWQGFSVTASDVWIEDIH